MSGPAPDGVNVGIATGGSSGPIDFLEQQLMSVLAAHTTYTLQVDVGRLSDDVGIFQSFLTSQYEVDLLAGNTLLARDIDSLTLSPGGWGVSTITYTALAGNPLLGQPLEILLSTANTNQGIAFDDVRLQATPEPSTAMLVALGGNELRLPRAIAAAKISAAI